MTVAAPPNLDQLAINTIRFLAVDAVQKAKSGHPGLPMGAAPWRNRTPMAELLEVLQAHIVACQMQ